MVLKILRLALIAAVCASSAFADDGDQLTGGFSFDREDDACPKLGTCTISFQVTGAAAKAIYEKMRIKAVSDECTGGVEKSDKSGMRCYKVDNEYNCDFGYSFAKKRFTPSLVTC
jgi:hypothetical protein